MGKSARQLTSNQNKSWVAEELLFKIGVLGRCDLCGDTVVVKSAYDNMDKLVSVVQKAHPNALKSHFDNNPGLMKAYITDEYADAPFQCEDCNQKFGDEAQ